MLLGNSGLGLGRRDDPFLAATAIANKRLTFTPEGADALRSSESYLNQQRVALSIFNAFRKSSYILGI